MAARRRGGDDSGGAAVIELVAFRARNPAVRIGFALFVVAVVALIWANAAVGISH